MSYPSMPESEWRDADYERAIDIVALKLTRFRYWHGEVPTARDLYMELERLRAARTNLQR